MEETMRVFIGWSGERSRQVAEALYEWLPSVIQAVEPWISTEDIDKGAKWVIKLTGGLRESTYGIICLTPENLEAPWLLFESGAISNSIEEARVSPYLYGLSPADVKSPLSIFQLTRANKKDTRKLIFSINKALREEELPSNTCNSAFEKWWPDLEEKLKDIKKSKVEEKSVQRTDRDLVEEILGLVRNLSKDYYTFPETGYATITTSQGLIEETLDMLSPSERSVLFQSALGINSTEIGIKRGHSTDEINNIKEDIIEKLGFGDWNQVLSLFKNWARFHGIGIADED